MLLAMGIAAGMAVGGSLIDSRNRNKAIRHQNKLIDKSIAHNKGTQNRLGIDARAAQDWAANQMVKYRNNAGALNSLSNMYGSKTKNAAAGVANLADQNSQLRSQKGTTQSIQSAAIGATISGASAAATTWASGMKALPGKEVAEEAVVKNDMGAFHTKLKGMIKAEGLDAPMFPRTAPIVPSSLIKFEKFNKQALFGGYNG